MYNAVGGSTIIFAGAWPRALPSDFRVRSLDGIADDWPIDYFELLPYFYRTDREFGVSGLPGDPAYPPDTEDAPMPPLPIGAAGLKVARGHDEARLALVAGVQLDQLDAVRRPPAVRPAEHLPVGLQRGRQGVDRPDPLAEGDRPGRPARHRRARPPDRDRRARAWRPARRGSTATAPSTSSRRSVVVLAANAIGTPRLLLLSASAGAPGRPGELVRPRRQAADDASLRERRRAVRGAADELAGPVRRPHRVARVLRDRREARLRPRRALGPGADRRPDQHGAARAAPASRSGAPTTTPHVKTHLGHGANWGLFAEDLPDEANHITLSSTVTDSSGIPAPEVHYRMSDNSRRMLDFHIERAKESMDAAGAYKIEVDRLMRYSGWHLLGTARMGDDPKTSVLDRWNRTHDVPNLYVVDGSCFVTSSGVNPTSTIVAIALRAADHMVETRFEQQVPA